MTENNDNILGLDSLDFMKDNGDEFFLTTEDKATYSETDELLNTIAKLKKDWTKVEKFTFEELELKVIEQLDDEVKMLIAEYERELAIWQEKNKEKDDLSLDKE